MTFCLELTPDKGVSSIHAAGDREQVIEVQCRPWSTGSWEGAGNPDEGSVQVLNHDGDVAQGRVSGTPQSSYSGYSRSLVSDRAEEGTGSFPGLGLLRAHPGPLAGAAVRGDELVACRRCALVADL